MKLLNKIINFVKENKIIAFSLVALALSFILLAIPGQFAHVFKSGKDYNLSGYEYIFNAKKTVVTYDDVYLGSKISGIGLAGFILMVLSFGGLFFSNKSSFATMLIGLALVTAGVFFFAMEANAQNIYSAYLYKDKAIINWASYVVGALVFISGALVTYKSIVVMKDEVKHPTAQKGPYYNYLKK